MPEPLLTEPVAVFLTIMAVILITPLISQVAHLPGIVGLIIGGILVGPHGINLLATGRTIQLLSTVGLIYLMFSAGLEIDLDQFNRVRKKSLLFGLLTFSLPQVSGVALGRILGLDWLASILLGSIFASHTLVAFPILSRLGILRNEAVSVTVGATVFTDVLALLVLAIIAGTQNGEGTITQILELGILMTGYAFLILLGLPRLGKLFFRHFTGRAVEFQFVLVALFVAAYLANAIGMHAIVGAFLAGLAINYTLPPRSRVVGQVLFLGESFFIPIFLMFIGMVLDPLAIVSNTQTLIVGVALTFAVYLTKYAAAWIAARVFSYTRDERMTMWGLSQAQAAATLATILVGVEIGLFETYIFNGAILMVLFTVITTSLFVQRFGPRLKSESPDVEQRPLFKRILVPIANPETQEHLITLASVLARMGDGTLYPINVATEVQGRVRGLNHQRRLLEADILEDPETNIQPIARVDSSVAKGVIRAAIEYEVTLIVLGWRGEPTFRQSIFGTVLDEIVWNASVPVVVSRITSPINALERVVLVVPQQSVDLDLLEKVVEMVTAIARALHVQLFILAAGPYVDVIQNCLEEQGMDISYKFSPLGENVAQDVAGQADPQDLIAVTTMGSSARFRSSLGRIPEEIAAEHLNSILVIRFP